MNLVYLIILLLCGLFSIVAAIFNWDFFFNDRKVRSLVKLFGRTATRIIYGLLGVFIICCVIILMFTR